MDTTYSQLPHPILVASGVIGFESRGGGRVEGREVKEGPLVKRRVNELSLLSQIFLPNNSATFALTSVPLSSRACSRAEPAAGPSLQPGRACSRAELAAGPSLQPGRACSRAEPAAAH